MEQSALEHHLFGLLRDYIDRRIDDAQRATDARFKESQIAVETARESLGERLEASNGVLRFLKEKTDELASKTSVMADIKPLQQELALVRLGMNTLDGKMVTSAMLEAELAPLRTAAGDCRAFRESHKEKASQLSVTVMGAVAVIGLFASLANFLVQWMKP